jgi:TatA/E family protein of Tat protein translocase
MFGLGAGELLIILVFALLFIGPKKLPELAKSLGKGLREFQKAKDDLMDHINHPEIETQKDDNTSQIAASSDETSSQSEEASDTKEDDSNDVDHNGQGKNV